MPDAPLADWPPAGPDYHPTTGLGPDPLSPGPLGGPGQPAPSPSLWPTGPGWGPQPPEWAPLAKRTPLLEVARKEWRWTATTWRRATCNVERARAVFWSARRIVVGATQTARSQLLELDLGDATADIVDAAANVAVDVLLLPLDVVSEVVGELRHRWLVHQRTPAGSTPYTGEPCCCGQRYCASYRWSPAGLAELGDPLAPESPAPVI